MEKRTQKRIILAALSLFFIFILGLVLSQLDQITHTETVEIPETFPKNAAANGFWIEADIIDIKPLNGLLTLQLKFFPPPEMLVDNGRLNQDITLIIDSASGIFEHKFQRGERMNAQNLSLALFGSPADYPFDQYQSDYLILELLAPQGDTATPIPFGLEFYTTASGYTVNVPQVSLDEFYYFEGATGNDQEVGRIAMNIEVQTSDAVFGFILFLIALQWTLAITAFSVSLVIIVENRKVTIPNFGWLGALVFAQISLRNAMPNTPPIGTLGDRLSFFWVLGIIAISMLALVITWVLRGE